MPTMAPLAVRPGRTATSPEPSDPRPLMAALAPWSAGMLSLVHAGPPLVLSHATSEEALALVFQTAPEITVAVPRQVAYEMLCTVSPGAARPSCAAVIRCQARPSRDVQITAA